MIIRSDLDTIRGWWDSEGEKYDTNQTGRRCRAGLWPGAAGAGTGSQSSRKSSLWSCWSASLWSYTKLRVHFVCFLIVCVCKMVCFTVIVTATHPISRKICLNCVRTFISGCRWPQSGATPRASKLYGLNFFSFQLPLKHNTSCYEKKSRKKERTDCTLFCCFHKLQQPSIQSAGFPLLGNNNFT